MTRPRVLVAALAATLLLGGCAQFGGQPAKAAPMVRSAVAEILPTKGNQAVGWAVFEHGPQGVQVTVDMWGLAPGSTHAIHVHEYGDARSEDGKAAGGHYNPEGHDHALPAKTSRHAGDLGNLKADGKGHAHYEIAVTNLSISGRNPVLGRAVILHAQPDDGGQPTGNAGARIAYGIIGIAHPDR